MNHQPFLPNHQPFFTTLPLRCGVTTSALIARSSGVGTLASAAAILLIGGASCFADDAARAKPGGVPAAMTNAPASLFDAAPADVPGGRLQALIENTRCYAALPRRDHRPDFRIVQVDEEKYRGKFFWFVDGAQKIGLLNLSFGEIELFRSFQPSGGAPVEYRMPAVHSWASLLGPRISIVPQGTWSNRGEMVYVQDRGERLRLRYHESFTGKTEMVHWFTLRFDPVLGYLVDCAFEMRSDEPRRFEYTNLLPNGVADSRDERKRFQKCLWARRDGTLCFMYQNPRSMMHCAGRDWADIPDDGGYVGFVAESDINPFLEILRSEPRTTFITCSVWYDQHVVALPPERKGDDGLYHITAAYRFLSLPLAVAKELEDSARTTLPASKDDGPMGFRQDVVNDFETLVPAGTLYNGCIWGHSAKYDRTIGRSGTHSLRLGGGESAGPIHGGPVLHVEHGKRYCLRAWVRTRGATGKGACLSVRPWYDSGEERRSSYVSGDTDWTRLEVEFKSGPADQHAIPRLIVEGPGTAWFDDIEFREL